MLYAYVRMKIFNVKVCQSLLFLSCCLFSFAIGTHFIKHWIVGSPPSACLLDVPTTGNLHRWVWVTPHQLTGLQHMYTHLKICHFVGQFLLLSVFLLVTSSLLLTVGHIINNRNLISNRSSMRTCTIIAECLSARQQPIPITYSVHPSAISQFP